MDVGFYSHILAVYLHIMVMSWIIRCSLWNNLNVIYSSYLQLLDSTLVYELFCIDTFYDPLLRDTEQDSVETFCREMMSHATGANPVEAKLKSNNYNRGTHAIGAKSEKQDLRCGS